MRKYIIENKLLFWLIAILISTAVFLVFIKICYNIKDEGVLINIATEIIGIVITIMIVNQIIEKSEKRKWAIVEKRVINRVQRLVNESLSLINIAFSINFGRDPKQNYINEKGENIFIVLAANNIIPQLENLFTNINAKTLDSYIYYLKIIEIKLDEIKNEYANKLPAFLFAKIFDLKDVISNIIEIYQFYTETHFINSEKLLVNIRSGDKYFNLSILSYFQKRTEIFLKIVLDIDVYLRKNYDKIEENFPYMIDYEYKKEKRIIKQSV